ncbi:hypothetical protein CANDROIZ_70028 [Candidatus Roizmanbacteria bacterium]|nr:hypothetical protein CANDROIZ_70028 [Candidatus Roizmanbacteria bacterium]
MASIILSAGVNKSKKIFLNSFFDEVLPITSKNKSNIFSKRSSDRTNREFLTILYFINIMK